MIGNYYTLLYLARTLDEALSGLSPAEIFSQEKGECVLTFPEKSLVFSFSTLTNTVFLRPVVARARTNSIDMLQECIGERVQAVEMHPSDRIMRFRFTSGAQLIARFFGAAGNLLFVNQQGVIVNSMRRGRELVGGTAGDRFDTSQGGSEPRLCLDNLDEPVEARLRKEIPTLGNRLVKEILFRADVPADATILSEQERESVTTAARTLLAGLQSPTPLVFTGPDVTPVFSLVVLRQPVPGEPRFFSDIHEAIRFCIGRRRAKESLGEKRRGVAIIVGRSIGKLRRTIAAVVEDLDRGERAREYERMGNLLLTYPGAVQGEMSMVSLSDAAGELNIPLDPRQSPVHNAQRYFEKAKRARSARHQAEERLAGLRSRLERLTTLAAALDRIQSNDEFGHFMKDHTSDLARIGLDNKGAPEEVLPFRVFTVEGGFQVLAGKSSANNDLLTMKHAKPNDLWFHARGASGSHVVLRVGTGRGEPGKRAREQAAAIAAYYSKMKTAKHVPVAMTERKYVHKPRGAPAGTVVIEREKVIFANPSLPAGSEE